jgi:hypothetical protein
MPNDPKEDEIPFVKWCDRLEQELKAALDDLAKIREAKSPSEKRDTNASVVSIRAEIEAAFCNAYRVTFVGCGFSIGVD